LSVIAAVTVPALAQHEIVEDVVDTTRGQPQARGCGGCFYNGNIVENIVYTTVWNRISG
jgi:hypothetical protein